MRWWLITTWRWERSATPFNAVPNHVDLEQRNPPKAALRGEALRMTELSERLDFSEPDRANEDKLNRVLWYAAYPARKYPGEFVGAHAKGLRALGLKLE